MKTKNIKIFSILSVWFIEPLSATKLHHSVMLGDYENVVNRKY